MCPLKERSTRRLVLSRADMPQSVQDLQRWPVMTHDESIPVFDPVDTDDDTDSVIDAFQRDLEGDAIPADTFIDSPVQILWGFSCRSWIPSAFRRRRRLVLVQAAARDDRQRFSRTSHSPPRAALRSLDRLMCNTFSGIERSSSSHCPD